MAGYDIKQSRSMRNVPSQLKRLNIVFRWMCVAFSSESIILIGAGWVLVFKRYLPFLSRFCTKHITALVKQS